jgi:hypothetical protein
MRSDRLSAQAASRKAQTVQAAHSDINGVFASVVNWLYIYTFKLTRFFNQAFFGN